VAEPGGSVLRGNRFESFGDGLIERVCRARFGGTQKLFELEPGLLDGVQVGRVRGQVQQFGALYTSTKWGLDTK